MSASSTAPVGSPSAGPARFPRSRAAWVILGAIVVVAILVMVLLFGGIPGVSLNASSGGSSTTHTLSFDETGLPTGTNWTVVVSNSSQHGISHSSTTASISFSEPFGAYSYAVPQVGAYAASPPSGVVLINSSDVSVPVAFIHITVPLGTVFSWGLPINDSGSTTAGCPSSSGHYCYIIPIDASAEVSTSNIFLSLMNAVGDMVTWPTGITVSLFSPTNASAVATYDVTTSTWALVPPYGGALSAGFTLALYTADTTEGLLGLMIVASGTAGFSGTVSSSAFS